MSDIRDAAEADQDRQGLLFETDWQYQESNRSESPLSLGQPRSFEGASSMLDLPNPMASERINPGPSSVQSLRKLLTDLEKSRGAHRASLEIKLEPDSPYVNHFLERAQKLYAAQDFKACLETLHEGLKLVPGHAGILSLIEKARAETGRRQTEMKESGLADRIAQLKTEAVQLFQSGRFADCVERFKLLTELEPANCDLRHYLEVCLEQVEKPAISQLNPAPPKPPEQQPSKPQSASPEVSIQPQVPAVEPASVLGTAAPDDLENKTTEAIASTPASEESKSNALVESSKPTIPATHHSVTASADVGGAAELKVDRAEDKSETARNDTEAPTEDPAVLNLKKLRIAYLAGIGLVAGAVFGAWLAMGPSRHSDNRELQSQSGVGQEAGDPQSSASSSVNEGDDAKTKAQKAFKQGRYLEANRLCQTILQADPDNRFAAGLKQEIFGRLSRQGRQAVAKGRWEEASVAWSSALKVFPGDREAAGQLRAAELKLEEQAQIALASKLEFEKKVLELHDRISQAVNSGRYVPPDSGNAMELIQQLQTLAPGDSFAEEKYEQVFGDLMAMANRSLQEKNFAQASSFVRQIETHFPETSELRSLRERIKAEEGRLAEARSSWLQKAEAALAAERYVTPADSNVIAYCTQVLAQDPQNARAIELKKNGFARAGTQARSLVQEARYDEARAIYSSLLYYALNGHQMPFSSQELKAEVDKLTYSAYAVIHDHTISRCTGRLRFNGYQIAFVPSTDSKDGFALKLSEVEQVESGDKLKVQIKGKSYRFQANTAKSPEEGRAKISEIRRRLSLLIDKVKS
jgi:tetratricopeptide (TPR) repeat protein